MNLDALRTDLAAKQKAARDKYAALTATAGTEDRPLTDAEKQTVQALVDEATALKARVDRAVSDLDMGRAIEGLVPMGAAPVLVPARNGDNAHALASATMLRSLGEQFVTHANYDFFRKGQHRSASAWRSDAIELHLQRGQWAATLTEDVASGGKLIVPDYRPGIQPVLFRRLVVADLIAPGTTDSNLITYMVEKTFVNAADTVAEGAVKPESTLTFDAVSDPVRKIAHWLPVTEEMLEDVAQIRSYIDARLRLGIELTEEDQLLNGSLVAPDVVGIRNRAGLAAAVPAGTDPSADAIYKQMMAIFASAFIMPDGVVMNPANWNTIQLSKTTQGTYLAGGPFVSPITPTLWGVPVAVTPAMPAGIALVGAFGSASQVFRKGGIRVEASNSHQDFFIKNLVAIRAEERLALAVYRPGAFGEVTGLT